MTNVININNAKSENIIIIEVELDSQIDILESNFLIDLDVKKMINTKGEEYYTAIMKSLFHDDLISNLACKEWNNLFSENGFRAISDISFTYMKIVSDTLRES